MSEKLSSENRIVEAILALAEQQRVANLIALATLPDSQDRHDEDSVNAISYQAMDALVEYVPIDDLDMEPKLSPEIAFILKLTKDAVPPIANTLVPSKDPATVPIPRHWPSSY